MTVRRIALGLVVASLMVVSALGVVAAVLERGASPRATQRDSSDASLGEPLGESPRHEARSDTLPRAARGEVPAGWGQVVAGAASYAVPPEWSRRPAEERVAYREDGVVIASGGGYAASSVEGCPVAWAVLAEPVRSSNAEGVARATALAWARGYAGLPAGALPSVSVDGRRARVEVPLGDAAAGCAGESAELTAVAEPVGDAVVTLVVARYLEVPGALSDAAYDGVLGSFAATAPQSE